MEEAVSSEYSISSRSNNSNIYHRRSSYEFDTNSSTRTPSTPTRNSPAKPGKGSTPSSKRTKGTPVKKIFKRFFGSASKKKKPKPKESSQSSSTSDHQSLEQDSEPSRSPFRIPKHHQAGISSGITTTTTSSQSNTHARPILAVQRSLSSLTEEDNTALQIQSPPRKKKDKLASVNTDTGIPAPDPPTSSPLMREVIPTSFSEDNNSVEDLFLPEESSSSGSDCPPSPVPKTPTNKYNNKAMQSPGVAIPTPQTRTSFDGRCDYDVDKTVMSFPHPLRTISESPKVENVNQSLNQSIDEDAFLPDDFKSNVRSYTWHEVQRYVHDAETHLRQHLEDRHQHMIDEMQKESEKSLLEHASQWKADSERDYQQMQGTLKEEREKTQTKHRELIKQVTEMADLKGQIENFKLERDEYESHIASLEKQLNDQQPKSNADKAKEIQKQKLDREFQELQEEFKALNEQPNGEKYREELEELRRKNAASEKRSEDLQKQLDQLKHRMEVRSKSRASDAREQEKRHLEELRKLQTSREEANQQVKKLQDQLTLLRSRFNSSSPTEDLIALKSEKAASERKCSEMQEQIAIGTEEKLAAQTSLQEAQEEIRSLRNELDKMRNESLEVSMLSEASGSEDLSIAQVEALRVLRQEDEEQRRSEIQTIIAERDSLKLYVKRLKEKHKNELMNSPSRAPGPGELNGDVVAKLQAEKMELELPLQETTGGDQSGDGLIQNAIRLARADAEQEIQTLKDEMERRDQEHEAEKRTIRADLSVQEISELTAEVQELQKRHQKEVKELKKQFAIDADKKIQHEVENSNRQFEEGKQQLEARYKQETMALTLLIEQLRDEHEEAIKLARQKSREEAELELKRLKCELEKFRIEFEDEKIEIIQSNSKEHDDLMSKLDGVQESSKAQIEAAHSEARKGLEAEIKSLEESLDAANEEIRRLESKAKECDVYQREVESLKLELAESKLVSARSSEESIREMQFKFEEDLEQAKGNSQEQIAALQKALEIANSEKRKLLARLQVLSSKLDEKDEVHKKELEESQETWNRELEALEESLKNMESDSVQRANKLQEENNALRVEADLLVQELRDSHNKEIDEMLSQLDLVEEEHKDKFKEKERMVQEKDAVISALGSQLAEAQSRFSSISEGQESLEKELNFLKKQLHLSKAEIAEKNEDINKLLAEHQKAMEDQEVLREQAIFDAEQEMIKTAEVQFNERNEHYKQLKHKFDNTVSKIAALEAEVEVAKKEAAEAKKCQESIEIDLADKLAEAKAAAAASDLNAAKKIKQFRINLEESKVIEIELRKQLEEAKTTSQSIQSTFASLVGEKEKLLKENGDLQAICEELMGELEAKA